MSPIRIAVEVSSFHGAEDIAYLDVRFGVPFVDKLKLFAPDSRFFRQIIDFLTLFSEVDTELR
ncbi:hypothetical protein T11_6668 [Trichinella zimbabwensis]|uniref:Uncharacterized protein n=1 Tax=Trichinella zimbabwensis TaxID=268475 RepID=A0A0V1HYZ5_9BILA|nr:hypothetical protein T11_6668 [Trichinella zimbabwensis]